MNKVSLGDRVAISFAAILWFLLLVFGGLAILLLLIAPWWVGAAVVIAAAAFALPVYWLRRVFGGRGAGWSPARAYVSSFVAAFLLASVALAFPIYYLSYLVDARPTLMPLVTLSDGRKTVQFQGMQHVGSETFYKNVVYDLREALASGYKLYYEGVRPVAGRPELQAWFDDFATGGKGDLNESYKALADGCGLQFQLDYFQGLMKDASAHPDSHVMADVDYLEMKTEYDRLMQEDAAFAAAMKAQAKPASGGSDALSAFLGVWRGGTPDQKRLMGMTCRGFFAWTFAQKPASGPKEKLILDFRNARLARRIADATDAKIYVTYGANHIKGFIADLQAIDPAWKVVATKWTPALANPNTRQGEID